MGYSSRYHAASLAAVFLALAVGILIGVGFGSDIVNGTADDLERSLAADLDASRAKVDDLEARLADSEDFGAALTPAVLEDRLRGRQVGIVALGGLEEGLADDVRAALEPAGADLTEIAVVGEPPDAAAAVEAIGGRRGSIGRDQALARASRLTGKSLVVGGPRFADLRTAMLTRYSGRPGGLDAVVVVRDQPSDMGGRQSADTETVEDGIVAGIQGALPRRLAVTAVGAERSSTDPSSVDFFESHDLASVDDVDRLAGQVALVYALGGAEGSYGAKDSADALLPDLLAPSGTGTRP